MFRHVKPRPGSSRLAPRRRRHVMHIHVGLCPIGRPAENAPVGRLDFQAANLPEANVEVDLSQEMFRDIFGIGDAAIAGVVEVLAKSPTKARPAEATQMAAQQAEALRQIIQLAGDVVREVHVRVYEDAREYQRAINLQAV